MTNQAFWQVIHFSPLDEPTTSPALNRIFWATYQIRGDRQDAAWDLMDIQRADRIPDGWIYIMELDGNSLAAESAAYDAFVRSPRAIRIVDNYLAKRGAA